VIVRGKCAASAEGFVMPQKQKPGGRIFPAGPVETERITSGPLLLLCLRLILLRQISLDRIG